MVGYLQYFFHERSPISVFKGISLRSCAIALFSSAFQAFGIYHVHSVSGVTEGGILGLTLFLQRMCGLSPAVTGFVLNAVCYVIGWKTLGKTFLFYSAVCTLGFSASYAVIEQFPPLWPELYQHPLLAAVLGALFIGIGVGLCVRIGGASCGDDALAMSLSHLFSIKIETIYLISDLTVLALSLTYIPVQRIAYSLLTVLLSGKIIGVVQRLQITRKKSGKD